MLRISRVRIRNYRSIKNIDLVLDGRNIIAGENNTGKSNLISGISLVFSRTKNIDITDFYFSNVKDNILIDVMLQEYNGNKCDSFTNEWYGIFGDKVVPYQNNDSVTIRFIGRFNFESDQFEVERKIITNYDNLADNEGVNIPRDFFTCFGFMYVSSDRDLSVDIKQQYSHFNKMINTIRTSVSPENKLLINEKLNDINLLIMKSFPKLKDIEAKLEEVGTILEKDNKISISPVPKNIDELKESIQILLEYNNLSNLPINNYGDGTKSWLYILSLIKSFELQKENNEKIFLPYASTLLIEEPESHLHSNAQKKIWNQLNDVIGQIIITTHSGEIIAESGITNLITSQIINSESTFTKPDFSNFNNRQMMKIMNQIIETKSSLIFANKILLVEGITDAIIFRGLFELLYGKKSHQCGFSIVRVDGKENFPLFMQFLQKTSKSFIVFADADARIDLNQFATSNSFDLTRLFFTNYMDIEETIYNVFKSESIEMFWRTTTWQHIKDLVKTKRIEYTILSYMEQNKTNYPYELLEILKDLKKIELIKLVKSNGVLNDIFDLIGKEIDVKWN